MRNPALLLIFKQLTHLFIYTEDTDLFLGKNGGCLNINILFINSAESAIVAGPLLQLIDHEPLYSAPVLLTSINNDCRNECYDNINNSDESICSRVSVWTCLDYLIGSSRTWLHNSILN